MKAPERRHRPYRALLFLCLFLSTIFTSCGKDADLSSSLWDYRADLTPYAVSHRGEDRLEQKRRYFRREDASFYVILPVIDSVEGNYFLNSLVNRLEKDFRAAVTDAHGSEEAPPAWLYGDYLAAEPAEGEYLSLLLSYYSFVPGEGSTREVQSLLIRQKDGAVLTLGDLLGTAHLAPLAPAILAHLRAEEEKTVYMGNDALTTLSLLDASSVPFLWEEEKLTLWFNPGTLSGIQDMVFCTLQRQEFAECLVIGAQESED